MSRQEALRLDCDGVDELAGAWALGALSPDEKRAVAEHLRGCDRRHQELSDAVGAADVLAMSLPQEDPPRALRDRIMRSIGQVPAEPAAAPPTPIPWQPRRRSWLMPAAASLAAAAVLAVAIWNVQLSSELEQREADLARLAGAIASGESVYRATGSAGSGYLIHADTPVLVASLPPAREGFLYEMWLLDAEGNAVAVGTFETDEGDAVTVVELERPLSGYAAFAITEELRREDAPTREPVLVAALPG